MLSKKVYFPNFEKVHQESVVCRFPSSVPVCSSGNYQDGEQDGCILLAISGTRTVLSIPYAVPDGSECTKLPKMATVPAFRARPVSA
jgi:hypothetical protein